jgi:predicted permease
MPLLARAQSLLRNWFRRGQVEQELDAELEACLEQLTEEKVATGMSPAEARRAARIELGGVEQVKRQVREVRAGALLETIWQDVRYGLRGLRRSPGFTAVVVTTLALGIGANGAIFSLANALLFRPLPVGQPDELVSIYTSDHSGPLHGGSSYPDYVDFRDRNDLLSGLVAYMATPLDLGDESLGPSGESERVFGEMVTGNYFSVLGVEPVLGRGFTQEEDRTPHPVAVVSHGLWQRRFAGDPAVIGRSIRINGHRFTVVGVAPPRYPGLIRGLASDVWVPLTMHRQAMPGGMDLTSRGDRGLLVMGRLAPGATLEQARARFRAIAAALHESHREAWSNVFEKARVVTVEPESAARVFPAVREPVVIFIALLMSVVGLVLLIACANVASLLLARAAARRRELAIRVALGAARARLVRQLVTESLLLSALGGAAGLLLAMWGTDLLHAMVPPLPFPVALDLGLDWRVVGFTAGVSLATSLLFGLVPALAASRPDLVSALKDDAGGGSGWHRARLRKSFVAGQVALSLVLLIGSGLFLRSLRNASAIEVGFDPEDLVALSVDLSLQGYDEERGHAFHRQLIERVRALPGVTAASLAAELPLGFDGPMGLSGTRRGITVEGYRAAEGEDTEVSTTTVGPDYFQTMKIPLVRGRGFSERDTRGSPGVVVVNQAFARRYWPGQEALGKRIQMGGGNNAGAPSLEVVGVVVDGKYATLGEEKRPFFYLPLYQDHSPRVTLVVRTEASPAAALAAARRAVRDLDRNLPIHAARTMSDHLAATLLPARMAAAVLGVFGLVALALAAMGLYGVVSFSVAQRTREIGMRMALGARRRDVLDLVIRQGMQLTLIGIAIGLAIAGAMTRMLSGLLYGVSAGDPLVFTAIALLLAAVAGLACYLPARRAARVDPMLALRHE